MVFLYIFLSEIYFILFYQPTLRFPRLDLAENDKPKYINSTNVSARAKRKKKEALDPGNGFDH